LPLFADVRNNAAMAYVADGSMLAGSPLFAGLDAAAREGVAAASHLVRLQAGETLFEQDDPAMAFYVLITGRVKIAQVTAEGHQVVIRYIAAGQVFGAVPLFTRTGYPASATGVVDSIAARWDQPATQRLFDHHPRVLANALTIVGERLQELQNRYRELATERVEQRVARAVLRLFGDAARPTEAARGVFPISRQDIAEMTGTTLHTVSRILSGWEHRGLVGGGRMRVVIHDPAGLLAIADDLQHVRKSN
jgi:CRP-like cAMP-binding protein